MFMGNMNRSRECMYHPKDMFTHNIFYPLQIVSWLMSNSLNAKCKYTHVLKKRELSASPFMQTAVCYIVLIKITLNTVLTYM